MRARLPHRHGAFLPWHRDLRGYVGARLHRRLFVGMGAGLLVAFGAAAAALYVLRPEETTKPNLARIESLFAHQFGETWNDVRRRNDLAERVSQAFAVPLELRDPDGSPLGSFGGEGSSPMLRLEVRAPDAHLLGTVEVHRPRAWKSGRTAFLAALAAATAGVWLFAGLLAHHLGRPLWALVQVTREIGTGKLAHRRRLNRHHGGEVGALAASIDDMAARIERQLHDQKELLATVSHEIRTPLTRLRVLSELLRDRGADLALVDDIEREIADIDDLTGRLLASSRLDFEAIERTALDAADLGRAALQREGLPVSLLEGEPTAALHGDATLLGRALSNLLSNARLHGGGARCLRVQTKPDRVELTVEDRGPGFRTDELPRVFEAFRRGQSNAGPSNPAGQARRQGPGALGLGLALVRRIARAHRGDAFAENLPGGGARVGLWIPTQ